MPLHRQTAKLPSVIMLCLFLLMLASNHVATVTASDEEPTIEFETALENIDEGLIKSHVQFFSEQGSRVTGYAGFFKSAQYIAEEFGKYGIQPLGADEEYFEFFNVTIPLDHGSYIVLPNGTEVPAYAVWPNYVNPSAYQSPPEGDPIVYVGDGSIDEYAGKNVTGRFVLMNFNSRWYFKIAASFEARGVIYILGDDSIRADALQKVYNVPLRFPRLVVSRSVGDYLIHALEKGENVNIWASLNMSWVKLKVPNIIGFVEGSGPLKDEIIAISAYYDSWSIVPGLSPGATDALGISVLLSLAKFLSENRPSRSVILLALAGHWQSLAGAREYVDRHFGLVGGRIKAFASLNLATESNQLGVYNRGSTYVYQNVGSLNGRYTWLINTVFKRYLPQLQILLSKDFGNAAVDKIFLSHPLYIQGGAYPQDFTGTYSFDSDPYTLACYGGGFAFSTTNAIRLYMKTPSDIYEKLNFQNLWPQVQLIFATVWGLLHEQQIGLSQSPLRFGKADWGYATLKVRVSTYNLRTAFWDPFASKDHPIESVNTVVAYASTAYATMVPPTVSALFGTGMAGGFGTSAVAGVIDIVDKPDGNGEVTIKGVKPFSYGYADAYVINGTGHISWATDLGTFQAPPSGRLTHVSTVEYTRLISIFECGSIAMFSLFDPGTLRQTLAITIYNHIAHGPMIHQSTLQSFYGDLMIFVEPETPTEMLVSLGPGGRAIGVLNNATKENPMGSGYAVEKGQTLRVRQTPYILAKSLFLINDERVDLASRYSVRNPAVFFYHNRASEYLNQIEEATAKNGEDLVYSYSFACWSYEQKAYKAMMDLIFQTIYTTVFFFLLLIPFVFIVESFLFGSRGLRRLINMFGLFTIFILILAVFHPGFHIANNTPMALLIFTTIIVTIPIIFFIVNETYSAALDVRERLLGSHFVKVSRTSMVVIAISTGIENMKKYKFRTFLTLVSITIVVFALLAFTSIAVIPVSRATTRTGPVLYSGVLMRLYPWTSMPEDMFYQIYTQYKDEALVAPRAWMFPPLTPGRGGIGLWILTPKQITIIKGILFVTPQERNITHTDALLVKGRWFEEQDKFSVILSEKMAMNLTRELGVSTDPGSRIQFLGLNLTVVGIINGEYLWDGSRGMVDLDGEAVTPILPFITPTGQIQVSPPHIPGDEILIMPYRLAMCLKEPELEYLQLQQIPTSIAIKPFDPSLNSEIAVDLALRTATDVVYAVPEKKEEIYVVRYREWLSSTGLSEILIPITVGGFVILSTMLGCVHERVRDIKVFVTVGLSPTDVMGMFLAEATVHAIISSVLGYLAGIVGAYICSSLDLYPPNFYPNYSSIFVVMVTLISQSMTIVSSIYPSIKAASIATPSLRRKWALPKPKEKEWTIPLPFVAEREEACGILSFLAEYFEGHASESAGSFICKDIRTSAKEVKERAGLSLTAEVHLAPFDLGIAQNFVLDSVLMLDGKFHFTIYLDKISGIRSAWISSNRVFVDLLRNQFLLWRVLSESDKMKYVNHFRNLTEVESVDRGSVQ